MRLGSPVALSALALAILPAPAVAAAPVIESEAVPRITATDATLEAVINPENSEAGADYQFQVVFNPSEYSSGFACPSEGFPADSSLCLGLEREAGALPIGGMSGGMEGHRVSLDLAGPWGWWAGGMTLKPGTTYHYRVIAAEAVPTVDTIVWGEPIVYGPDRTFTTPLASNEKPPVIEGESVSHVMSTDAVLEAKIDPEGLATSYSFWIEWGCLPPRACSATTTYRLPAGEIQASSPAQRVTLDLNSAGVTLRPDTEYRYGIEASNVAGGTEGAGRAFTTPEAPERPKPEEPIGSSEQSGVGIHPVHRHRHRRHRRHRHRRHSAGRRHRDHHGLAAPPVRWF